MIKISRHAEERYAERIMSKDDKGDIIRFISNHKEKIQKDFEKMIAYGTLLYTGTSLKDKNRKCEVYLNDLWVLIFDPGSDTVVTLYRIDLGVGEDLNKEFLERALNNITLSKEQKVEIDQIADKIIQECREIISQNENEISKLKQQLKRLEEENKFNLECIKEQNAKKQYSDDLIRQNVEILIGRKTF